MRTRWDLRDPQRGSTSVFVAIVMAALLAMTGLLIDGADKARAGRVATTAAAEAARAAGQTPGREEILGRADGVDPAAAAAAARSYLAAAGVQGSVTVTGDRIRIRTSVMWTPRIYTFIPSATLTGQADALLHRT